MTSSSLMQDFHLKRPQVGFKGKDIYSDQSGNKSNRYVFPLIITFSYSVGIFFIYPGLCSEVLLIASPQSGLTLRPAFSKMCWLTLKPSDL